MRIDDSAALLSRFWAKVDRNGPIPEHCPELGPCWIWTGSISRGYGQFRIGGRDTRPIKAHRVSFALAHDGYVQDGQDICHACDFRPCVRPSHLFDGTRLDNVTDAVAKLRHSHGAGRPASKLTEDDVRAIRAIPEGAMNHGQIAERYSVSRSVIGNILRGTAWTHVR